MVAVGGKRLKGKWFTMVGGGAKAVAGEKRREAHKSRSSDDEREREEDRTADRVRWATAVAGV